MKETPTPEPNGLPNGEFHRKHAGEVDWDLLRQRGDPNFPYHKTQAEQIAYINNKTPQNRAEKVRKEIMKTEDHKRKNCFNCKFLDATGPQFWCNGKELSNPEKEDAQLKKINEDEL
jgi:hypothetical protein